MLTLWLFLPLGAIFVFIGLAVHVFKWYSMISGYNTMSKEQKANVDVEGLSKAVGIFCYVNGGLFLLTGILSALGVEVSVFIPFGVLLVSAPYFVSSVLKYDKNPKRKKLPKASTGLCDHFSPGSSSVLFATRPQTSMSAMKVSRLRAFTEEPTPGNPSSQ